MYTYKLGGMLIADELYHDDLEVMTFGRKDQNELMHYGIKGQSWGKRRFQNEDGSLTMAGRNRYDVGDPLQGSTNRAMAANRTYAAGGGTGGFGGASGGGGSVKPFGSPTTRFRGSTGSYYYESNRGPGQSAGRTVTNKVKAKVNDTVNSGRKAADSLFGSIGNTIKPVTDAVGKATEFVTGANANRRVADAQKAYDEASENMLVDNRSNVIGTKGANAEHDAENNEEWARYHNSIADVYDRSAQDRGLFDRAGREADEFTRDQHRKEAQDYAKKANDLRVQAQKEYADDYRKLEEAERNLRAAKKARDENTLGGVVGNAAKDAGNWLGNAFNDAKNWVGDRAQDVGKAATNAYNDVSKAAGDAVNWVGDRARDVGNLVSNQDEKRAAENAQNVADRILEDAIARSGEYVPDEKGGEDLYIRDYNDAKVVDAADKRVADAKQVYENHPLTKIQNAANDVKSLLSDGSKEREALAEARSKIDESADDPEFMSYFYEHYPEEAKRFADEQAEARKQLEQAEKNYMDFSNNPVNTVSRALNLPNNKGNWAFAVPGNEQYLQTMKTGFIPKTENIGDWFTGNNYKRTADTHNQYAKDYEDLADQAYAYGRESAETGRGPSQDWWNSEGDYIKNVYAKEDRDIADVNMNMYNNAPRQKIVNAANQVGETVSGAAKDVANWGGQQVENGKKLFKKIFG